MSKTESNLDNFSSEIKSACQKIESVFKFILLTIILSTSNLYGQNKKKVDSLLTVLEQQKDTIKINTYTQLFIEHINVDPEIAKTYVEAQMRLADSIENKLFIGRTKMNYCVYLFNTSKFEESIKLLDQLLIDFDNLGNNYYKAAVLVNRGNAYRELGNFEKALEDHIASLKINEEHNSDKESIAISYWNIGNLLDDLDRLEESTGYYKKSKVLFKELKSESDTIILNLMIAQNLRNTPQEFAAVPLFKDAVNFFQKVNAKQDMARVYDYLGLCYMNKDSLNTALNYFEKALNINRAYSDEVYIGTNLRHVGQIHLKKGNANKALTYFEESLIISKDAELQTEIMQNYKAVAEAQAMQKNYRDAYKNIREHQAFSEEILNAENIERMNELEVKYQTEKKEKDLLLKGKEIDLLEERKKKAENQRLFFIITALGILALAIAVIYGLRQKMKRNKIEKQKVDNDLEFKEKQLTTHALHLAHKNEVLLDLKEQLKTIKSESKNSREFQNIINNINLDINNDNNWEQFKSYFEDVHKDFNSKIINTYPEVSNNDLRLMSLLKMNLSSKEIANILNISAEGVKKARYRLRKKLNLSTEESLQELVISM